MRSKIFPILALLALACILTGGAAASTLSFSPSSVTLAPGGTTQVAVLLSDAPTGLAGYELTLVTPTSTVIATDATFPSWASLNRKNSVSGGYTITGVDLNKQVQSGATNIALGTVTLKGVSAGSATISISGIQMNADDGALLTPGTDTLKVTVSGEAVATAQTTETQTTVATTTTTSIATTTATGTATTLITTAVTTAETTAPIITVTPVIPGAPVTGFTANPVVGYAPLKVQFMDRSSGSPTSFEWDFGDGGSAMIENPAYTYQKAGTYTVTLTATNEMGSTKNARAGFITVVNPGETLPVTSTPTLAETQTVSTTRSGPVVTSSWKPTVIKTKKAAPDLAIFLFGAGIVMTGIFFLQKRRHL